MNMNTIYKFSLCFGDRGQTVCAGQTHTQYSITRTLFYF